MFCSKKKTTYIFNQYIYIYIYISNYINILLILPYLSSFILHLPVHPCYPRYAQAHASPAPRSSSADAPWPSPRCPRARRGAPYRRPPRHLERCGDGGRWRLSVGDMLRTRFFEKNGGFFSRKMEDYEDSKNGILVIILYLVCF